MGNSFRSDIGIHCYSNQRLRQRSVKRKHPLSTSFAIKSNVFLAFKVKIFESRSNIVDYFACFLIRMPFIRRQLVIGDFLQKVNNNRDSSTPFPSFPLLLWIPLFGNHKVVAQVKQILQHPKTDRK